MEVIETVTTRIAIRNLVVSPLNVRRKQGGGIEELAALIASQGLIHNLVVVEQAKKGRKTGKYEVIAGGRRLAALNLLVSDGRLTKDHEVDCRIVEAAEALELSLTENSGREDMHPADLVMAYRKLTEAGLAPDEIAPRFGVSPLTVKRYLKLTHVSPGIFALYAEDRMNFEQISALALTDDHELQERLWHNTPEWQRNGATFRRLITEAEIDIRASPLARFVGAEEYEAAGGLIRRDLFAQEGEGYMQDAELLESLALEKLNQAVEPLRKKGYAWVQVRTTFDRADRVEFTRMQTVRREPTASEQARMDALEAELAAVESGDDGGDEEMGAAGGLFRQFESRENKAGRIRAELAALDESLEEAHPDELAIAGAIVTIDQQGRLLIERGLIRKEDVKRKPRGQPGGQPGERLKEPAGQAMARDRGGIGEPGPVHSEKLTRMLTAQRTAAIQAAMIGRPEIALAALAHRLVPQVFGLRNASSRLLQVDIEHARSGSDAGNIGQSRAATAIGQKRQYWQKRIEAAGQAGQGGRALFEWLLQLDMPDLQQLLAFCAAVSVDTVSGSENTLPQDVAELMGALNLDMADWWQPTRENYLAHVSKDRILAVMTEATSPEQAKAMRGLRKEQLAQKAEEELTARRWLPLNFRPVQVD